MKYDSVRTGGQIREALATLEGYVYLTYSFFEYAPWQIRETIMRLKVILGEDISKLKKAR